MSKIGFICSTEQTPLQTVLFAKYHENSSLYPEAVSRETMRSAVNYTRFYPLSQTFFPSKSLYLSLLLKLSLMSAGFEQTAVAHTVTDTYLK